MSNIPRFEVANPMVYVILGKKKIGVIKFNDVDSTWAYYPGGKKKHKGEDFTTLTACKNSVIGVDEEEAA